MNETAQLGLPLLLPAQAQKHVTVNEALSRLDGLVQLVLGSVTLATPPLGASEGQAWGVPVGAVNEWAGQSGRIAIATNGGWDFVQPRAGWRAQVIDRGVSALHDGAGWRVGHLSLSPFGAGVRIGVVEADHLIAPGAASVTADLIPSHVMVLGVTARVIQTLTGTLTDWALGNPGAVGRFGSGLGLAPGSHARGILASPMTFYAPTPLELVANGGAFAAGTVRLSVHYLDLTLPSA